MFTFFTTAKPFREHNGIIQRNALKSWTLVHRDVEVILFGDEEGAEEIAKELGLRHEPHVERNEFGTKRLDFMFSRAQAIATHDLLCYINCDILLMQDFATAVKGVREKHSEFLMVGRRWDIEITVLLSFGDKDWESLLRQRALRNSRKRGPEWIDYFVFRVDFTERTCLLSSWGACFGTTGWFGRHSQQVIPLLTRPRGSSRCIKTMITGITREAGTEFFTARKPRGTMSWQEAGDICARLRIPPKYCPRMDRGRIACGIGRPQSDMRGRPCVRCFTAESNARGFRFWG